MQVPGAEGGRTNRTQTAFLQRAAGPRCRSCCCKLFAGVSPAHRGGLVYSFGAAFSHFGALVRRDWVCLPEGEGGGSWLRPLTSRFTNYKNKVWRTCSLVLEDVRLERIIIPLHLGSEPLSCGFAARESTRRRRGH